MGSVKRIRTVAPVDGRALIPEEILWNVKSECLVFLGFRPSPNPLEVSPQTGESCKMPRYVADGLNSLIKSRLALPADCGVISIFDSLIREPCTRTPRRRHTGQRIKVADRWPGAERPPEGEAR